MKILNFVKLSEDLLGRLRKDFPEIELVNVYGVKSPVKYLPGTEIIFGNCSIELIEKAKELKWLQIVSSGVDVYQSILHSGILVTTAKGVHSRPIAEHLLMMMMNFSRKYELFRKKQQEKIWYRQPDYLELLSFKKLGIIGFGNISRALINLIKPFNMSINAVTRRIPAAIPEEVNQIRNMEYLDELLSISDHIVLTLPYTNQTKGIIDIGRLAKIKKGAFLYNISRGGIIDEAALMDCVKNKRLGGVALDVFETEPLPPESPWWEMENVVITPHIAGHYNGLREAIFELFRENLKLFLEGKPMRNMIDLTL